MKIHTLSLFFFGAGIFCMIKWVSGNENDFLANFDNFNKEGNKAITENLSFETMKNVLKSKPEYDCRVSSKPLENQERSVIIGRNEKLITCYVLTCDRYNQKRIMFAHKKIDNSTRVYLLVQVKVNSNKLRVVEYVDI